MNAKVISFPVPDIQVPEIPRSCWPCFFMWLGMPAFWVFVFWMILR